MKTHDPSRRKVIPVYEPDLSGNEKSYVMDCLDSSWISSIGSYIDRFERSLASVVGVPHAISVSNGTVALHLALHCLDIGPGDEVIVPSFTYIASVNAIAQTGARPVFADSQLHDWQLDPHAIEPLITSRTRAILPVHLYGAVCDMPAIMQFARRHNLYVVEDCAECLGASRGGIHPGAFGDIGTFSFFGNKTITTGEGGAVVARDNDLARRLRRVKGQGQSLTRRYWHEELGFNYRMTNVAAAIGLAQLERLEDILRRKRAIAQAYRRLLSKIPVDFQLPDSSVNSTNWLVSILLPRECDRARIMAEMMEDGVETRPVFYGAHQMPMYANLPRGDLKRASEISARGMSLPSFPTLSPLEIDQVVASLCSALARQGIASIGEKKTG